MLGSRREDVDHFYGGAYHTMTREEEATWESRLLSQRLYLCAGNNDTCQNRVSLNIDDSLCVVHRRQLTVAE